MAWLLMVIGAGLIVLQAVGEARSDPSIDRRFVFTSLRNMAFFLAFSGVGLAIAMTTFGPATAGQAGLFILFWVLEGILWLIRKGPRHLAMPRWLGAGPNLLDAVIASVVLVFFVSGVLTPGQAVIH